MKHKFKLLAFLLSICLGTGQKITAQPFIQDIQAFRKSDSLSTPQSNAILFVGSSSFTMWKDVQEYFPAYPIINRGFGGSTLQDVIMYESDVIFPYKPKQIIIYCGENDVAGDSTITGKIVFGRFKKLYSDIRNTLGNVPLVYVSMKPSPSRWHMRSRTIEGNRLIEKFLKKKKNNGKFLNVWNAMLGTDGAPRKELFIGDMLHMNKDGYKIWQALLRPLLIK